MPLQADPAKTCRDDLRGRLPKFTPSAQPNISQPAISICPSGDGRVVTVRASLFAAQTTGLAPYFPDQCYVNRNESRPALLAVNRPPRVHSGKGRGRKSLRAHLGSPGEEAEQLAGRTCSKKRQGCELNANLSLCYVRVKLACQKTTEMSRQSCRHAGTFVPGGRILALGFRRNQPL